jgi:predicted porin
MKATSCFAIAIVSACTGAAHAQSNVTVYGLLDAGLVSERGCADCPPTRLSSGIASGSRLGVRGSEALGGGTAAIFTLESGVEVDTGKLDRDQGGRLFGRQAFVGLQGPLGSITLGRQYNLQYLALTDVGDPFKGGMAGSATNLVGYSSKRIDNSVQVASPEVNGLSAIGQYGFGEISGDAKANSAWGVSLGLDRGPLTMRAAYQYRNLTGTPAVAMGNSLEAKNAILAANLKLGIGTVYAAYSVNRGWGSSPLWNPDNPYGATVASTPSTDNRDVLAGLAVPLGATTFLASYIHKNDRDLANRDAEQLAVGGSYSLSRRTDVYAAWSHIKNKRGAGYTVGNASDAGAGSRAINIGMRHAF